MSSSNIVKFDQKISNIEDVLSTGAAIPVIGTIPGLVKVVLGAVQLVSAAFAVLYGKASGDLSLQNHAWTHIKHGAGNMVAGTFEAIPVVGSIMGLIRLFKRNSPAFPSTQHNKFMIYTSVMKYDSAKVNRDAPSPTRNNAPPLPTTPIPPLVQPVRV